MTTLLHHAHRTLGTRRFIAECIVVPGAVLVWILCLGVLA